MKLILGKEIIEYNKSEVNYLDILKEIEKKLSENKYIFTGLKIDEKEVLEGAEKYLMDNFNNINTVEITYINSSEFIKENWILIEDFADQIIPIINELGEDFYQNQKHDIWARIWDLRELILESIESLEDIDVLLESLYGQDIDEIWTNYYKIGSRLNDKMISLKKAIELEDSVLLGDILIWEMLDIIKGLKKYIKEYIDIV